MTNTIVISMGLYPRSLNRGACMTDRIKLTGTGFAVGIASGLLGIGGGVFLIPILVSYFAIAQHKAQGISLAVVIPTGIVSSIMYGYHGYVDLALALNLIVGGVIGATFSARYVSKIPAQRLKQIFGIMLILVGIRMVMS